jgi:hypothetical protein
VKSGNAFAFRSSFFTLHSALLSSQPMMREQIRTMMAGHRAAAEEQGASKQSDNKFVDHRWLRLACAITGKTRAEQQD